MEHGLRERPDGRFELKCRPEDEAAIYTMGMVHDTYRLLPAVAAPTVVVCGELTDAIAPKMAGMIAERLPAGRLEVMPGLGHFGPLEDPDATVASMLRFADETA
ncbi:MAG: alpha/beta hydrolase [Acidimicrobiia bacterium]|nr:alpha/beta hydrolase [Acidimicrobiia bacterium]